jgi:hypothetical protein
MRDQSGMGLVEALVAAALLAVVIYWSTTAVNSLNVQSRASALALSRDQMVESLMVALRGNLGQFQMNFSPMDPGSVPTPLANPSSLPMAWSDTVLTEVNNCPSCPGRLGYSIQPISGDYVHGLRLISIRVIHPALNGGNPKDYQIVVSEK